MRATDLQLPKYMNDIFKNDFLWCGDAPLRSDHVSLFIKRRCPCSTVSDIYYMLSFSTPQPKQTQITVAEKLSEFFFSSIYRQVISHLKPSLSKKSRQVLEESFKVKTHFTFDKPFIKTQFPYINYVILTAIGCNTW